ncbi:uncharacterized protein JN550_003594 [Neoarthrinium moseri]|uniref:uncharacterized protein n=1 Tax=Neoarthrinium moseri TaxID=1658444 RepID=UPI001FDB9F72|nr:uncharacterized protein JN550_003594 [Neoarthrinium moseri]KAI1872720.1 hypothetical protein JN550_003594 [Neoarthrinium moseri]
MTTEGSATPRANVAGGLALGNTSLTSELAMACFDMLRQAMGILENEETFEKEALSISHAAEAFTLWMVRHRVPDGDLDKVLVRSEKVHGAVIASLRDIALKLCRDMNLRMPTRASEEPQSKAKILELESLLTRSLALLYSTDYLDEYMEDEGDTEDSPSEHGDLESCIYELVTYVQCLIDLDPAIAEPTFDPGATYEETFTIKPLDKHHQYVMRIRDLFPETPLDMADLLGKSNLRRYWELIQERETATTLLEGRGLITAYDNQGVLDIDCIMAERLAKSSRAPKSFHDSGIGSSVQTQSVYARSARSSAVSNMGSGRNSAFPAIPSEAKSGDPFLCEACNQFVKVTKSRHWKQHLIEDLKPYVCIYAHCSAGDIPFPNRQAWSQHMRSEHSSAHLMAYYTCPFCPEVREGETTAMLVHVCKHLEVISAIILPRNNGDSDESSDSESIDEAKEPFLSNEDVYHSEASQFKANTTSSSNVNLHDSGSPKKQSTSSVASSMPNITLDKEFTIKPSKYFVPGEVFKFEWLEPNGSGSRKKFSNNSEASFTEASEMSVEGEMYYTSIRRFVVVSTENNSSICVPILTYEGRGCNKPGVQPENHGIVYEPPNSPTRLRGEPAHGFGPVRMQLYAEGETLVAESRINYSKLVSIEHNFAVMFIGRIYSQDFGTILGAVDHCWARRR